MTSINPSNHFHDHQGNYLPPQQYQGNPIEAPISSLHAQTIPNATLFSHNKVFETKIQQLDEQ